MNKSQAAQSSRCECYNHHDSTSGRCNCRQDGAPGLVIDPTRLRGQPAICRECRMYCPVGSGEYEDIEYLDENILHGFTAPGWYFLSPDLLTRVGPYESPQLCLEAQKKHKP